ncbi:FHA domain-containing protein [Candidatus Bathyarchaeota archaeon]|nr:FHA domain-containing protein [Candidatus Bathyarchaeota archaeon]
MGTVSSKHVFCPECGGRNNEPDHGEELMCEYCSSIFKYRKKERIDSRLEFIYNEKRVEVFDINDSIKLSRNNDGRLFLKSVDFRDKTTLKIRTHWISQPHFKITVKEENILLKDEEKEVIVSHLKCYLSDLGSRNGTYINNEKILPIESRLLKNKDIITTSPEGPLNLRIIYRERIRVPIEV